VESSDNRQLDDQNRQIVHWSHCPTIGEGDDEHDDEQDDVVEESDGNHDEKKNKDGESIFISTNNSSNSGMRRHTVSTTSDNRIGLRGVDDSITVPRVNPHWAELPLFDRTGWRSLPFGEFAQSVNERVEPSEAADDIYVGLEHLDSQNLHIRRFGKGSDVIGTKLRFRKGDIIFGRRRAYQRKLAIAEFDGICSAHAMVVRAMPGVVLPEFLPFLMMSDRFMNRAVEISVGSLSPTINWTTLKLEEFALPPLDQQRRIAEVLWAVDEATCSWREASLAAEECLRATSDSVFEANQRNRHLLATEACDRITVGIVVKPASYYTDRQSGVPALRSLNVFPGRYDLAELVYLTKDGHEKNSKSALKKDDVVVVRTGRPGDAAVVTDEIAGMNVIDLIIVGPKPLLLPEYLVEFLNSAFGRRRISQGSAGTAQQHFNVSEFKRLDIPVPPIGEQHEAVNLLKSLKEGLQVCQEQMHQLEALLP
jgi:hypothetical protein